MPETRNDFILGAKWAARLCALLLAGLVLLVVFGAYDKSRLAALEKVEEPTAVGDAAFFKPPDKFDSSTVLAKFGSQPLYPKSKGHLSALDSKMTRAGFADASVVSIYKLTGGKKTDGDFFLKTAPGEYLEVLPK